MMVVNIYSLLIFMAGFGLMLVFKKNLFLMILSLEFLIISMSLIIFYLFMSFGMEFFMIYFLILSVSENILLLCLLINMVDFAGFDKTKSLNLVW